MKKKNSLKLTVLKQTAIKLTALKQTAIKLTAVLLAAALTLGGCGMLGTAEPETPSAENAASENASNENMSTETASSETASSENSADDSQISAFGGENGEFAVPKVPEGERPNEIVISLEGENSYVNEAAEKYMALHDGVKITVKQVDTQNSRDKYLQVVSTELMSGSGADIYDAIFLSYYKLADSGMLADFNEYIGEDVKNGSYSSALMDAALFGGKRYTAILSYNFNAYEIDTAAADEYGVTFPEGKIGVSDEYGVTIPDGNLKLSDLQNLSEQLPKDGSLALFSGGGSGMNDLTLADLLVAMNFNKFVDLPGKSANFETDLFYDVINTVNRIAENKQIGLAKNEDYGSDGKALIHPYMLYTPAMSHNGTVDYKNMRLIVNDDGFAPFSCASFLPVLNANGKNKELAADFIKFMLSDEMQSSPSLLFCPVNKNAINEISHLSYEDSKSGGYLPEGFTEDTLGSNIAKFNELSENLGIFLYQERYINRLIWDELSRIFSEGITAQEAAANLTGAVNLYLNE
ncbi:MAG: extracellular solute-binding protein [Clostridiales bacterium]|jgi:multiple sugar transport system substrate-binding protein|nr:extracellular solute-binding protein [Clostridiales bacterium]